MRHLIVIISLVAIFCTNTLFSRTLNENLLVKPKSGEAVIDLISRFGLNYSKSIDFFNDRNSGKLSAKGGLLLHNKYELPIKILKYDGNSIRSTIGISDYDLALKIQTYNSTMNRKGLKKRNYKIDGELWVPFIEFDLQNSSTIPPLKPETKQTPIKPETSPVAKYHPKSTSALFGEKNQISKRSDGRLKNHFFYLIAGHGGPDPGAIGFRDGNELHEHEYAYDVTLRLAKKLMESGAEVYMIVQDPNDGIRDVKYLNNNSDEFLINGDTISHIQKIRLNQRTDIVNDLYKANRSDGRHHLVMEIHVDSRITDKRIDIFFYHQPGSDEGKKFCNTLLNTIKNKYDKNQPGRGYAGTVTSRNLFTLRNAKPVGLYIELGNIQNPIDQIRITDPNNRQAIANWLLDGLLNAFPEKRK